MEAHQATIATLMSQKAQLMSQKDEWMIKAVRAETLLDQKKKL